MPDIEFMRRIEQIGEDALAGDRAGRQRRDEFLRRLGENAADREAALFQAADKVERFVGGDAAANDQQDTLGRGGFFDRRRGGAGRWLRLGVAGGLAQNGADFVLDRTAMTRRAQPQLLF